MKLLHFVFDRKNILHWRRHGLWLSRFGIRGRLLLCKVTRG